ncbi:hypothetical protein FEM48_Zijuj09G0160400 [Ziziphus jujuba var. spinosa]|uniref:Malectin-like domain-containing protein n=1 Tax=Ziziphus jujuba var. spinosa TaxID=714518 RepID=A0A978UTY5_ZIZJJ|nr:hypothetical protein FEM48_Zijuj09G0160400 [Ziziphus jujuba var. spinosa]
MYFAELELLAEKNQSRKFNVSWNGAPFLGTISPRYLFATTVSSSGALVGNKHLICLYQTKDSTNPPILNALEIYVVKHMNESPTYIQDVNAIGKVKATYQINKNWAGDPCSGPKNFVWEGLKCSYNTSVPRIISLNLTSSNLSGIIDASIKELSLLEFLNLKGNQLSGNVPSALVKRWEAGLLTLSVDSQNLCGSGSCIKKKKINIVPMAVSLPLAVIILILLVLGWRIRRKGKTSK